MVHDAVLAACDARDGVKDGVIDSPTSCGFDPHVLACKGADGPSCLTAAQVETMRGLYSPIKNGRGTIVSPPLLQPGTELAWGTLAGPKPLGLATEAMQVRRVQGRRLGLAPLQSRDRLRHGLEVGRARPRLDRSEPEAVLRSRRQAAHVSRLGRSAGVRAEQRQLFRRCREDDREGRGRRNRLRSTWCPAWATVREAPAPIRSTRWARSNTGSRRGERRSRSSRLTSRTGRPIARVRCARTRKSRSTKDRAARTRPRTSSASRGRAAPLTPRPTHVVCRAPLRGAGIYALNRIHSATPMGNLIGDIRYAWRSLSRQPTFAAVAVLTLVLGIGANTAIFSVIKAVLLNQLPYQRSVAARRAVGAEPRRPHGSRGAA